MKCLLDHGIEIDARDSTRVGQTALMIASEVNPKETLVALLLADGADTEIKDHRGKTALQYASEVKHEGVMKLLSNAGASM